MIEEQMTTEKVDPIRPVKKGRFKSPEEMIRAMSEDEKQSERTVQTIRERCVVDFLMAQRASRGLSQTDIAKKMDCTQSRVSKLENGKDDELRIGDFRDYLNALDMELSFSITRKNEGIVSQVKRHVFSIRDLLMRLVNIAGKDHSIADGAKSFFNDVILNSVMAVADANDKLESNLESADKSKLLPELPDEPPPIIQRGAEMPQDRTRPRPKLAVV